jgi:hypothetical protein
MRVGNWPPGWHEPERHVDCPEGMLDKIKEAKKNLQEAEEELRVWNLQTEQHRLRAWIKWHDENGWPEDELYKALLLYELMGLYVEKNTI